MLHKRRGKELLEVNAYIVPRGKPQPICQVTQEIIEVLHDLTDCEQPDDHFEESEQGRVNFISFESKIRRSMPMLTSMMRAIKISKGKTIQVKIQEFCKNENSIKTRLMCYNKL